MTTQVLRTDTADGLQYAAETAARLLRGGDIVAMPTETVYGLAANAFDVEAVNKVFAAKGRPQDNPLIVHIADIAMLDELVSETGEVRERLIKAFWPGPLTVIFPRSEKVSDVVTAGLDTVAVRMPSHRVALKMIQEAGVPIAAPSANLSGKPSPTSAEHVFNDLNGKIPLIVDGGSCDVGVESTVVSVKGNTVTVLRPGGVTVEMIKAALPASQVTVAEAVMRPLKEGETALSPGMKHKHYSPNAKVILCEGDRESTVAFVNSYVGKNAVLIADESLCSLVELDTLAFLTGAEDEARHIFDYLRRGDSMGYDYVIIPVGANDGMGLAVNNRLLRAAGFEVVRL